VGVSVFVLGPKYESLTDNKAFAICTSLLLLALLAGLNIVGSAAGKWLNNVGAIGTCVAAAVLVLLGAVVSLKGGLGTMRSVDFRIPHDPRLVMNSFGVICFALVGLELASIMGDEIESPRRTLPSAVAWGGIISGFLYIATTLTLLAAVGSKINVLQGVMQAIGHLSSKIGIGWIIPVFAFMLSVSIAGIGSAWLGGSARIPFVAGLDSYMPSWLGRIHPKYGTPFAALLVHVLISMALCVVFFGFSSVEEAFQTMLSLAVVLQLIPYVYIFGALLKLAVGRPDGKGVYSRVVLIAAGVSGLVTTVLGIVLQYFPPELVKSLGVYETEMILGTAAFVGLAAYFFFVYGRRKSAETASIEV
ncbi:MAG: APC family permease, partial [Candidatus Sulfotelmatobacter sp.]